MRRYSCPVCANEVHFDNLVCLNCNAVLGYDPMSDCVRASDTATQFPASDGQTLKVCGNRSLISCNWLTPQSETGAFCQCCERTRLIPDLSAPANLEKWRKLEHAKRALFYSLLKFRLPVNDPSDAYDNPLMFEFKADTLLPGGWKEPVLTGHANGLVTINIAEADDAVRERQRTRMGEPYRTLIGHFRHEIGHFYWDRLVASDYNTLDEFRTIFGFEGAEYSQALQNHYQFGAPAGWEISFVSAYASSHPWEDFAETFAHYFHIVDGLETAQAYGLNLKRYGPASAAGETQTNAYEERDITQLVDEWVPLTVVMNAMNRSIGNADFYPFVLSGSILTKLRFVHGLVHAQQPSMAIAN